MSNPYAAAPESAALQQLRRQIAEVDGMPLQTPFYQDSTALYARIDRLEAKGRLLSDYAVYLLARIEALEGQRK